MNEHLAEDPDALDPDTTVKLHVRNSVLAQIEAALLAEKLAISEATVRRKGADPYNQATAKADSWAINR
jgi:hypothetical protein